MNDRPDITQIVYDFSFYNDADSSTIIEGLASIHISMIPNVGDLVLLTTDLFDLQDENESNNKLPFYGVVTRVERNYHLAEADRKKHPYEWGLYVHVYVQRRKSIYDPPPE